ncbi:DUF2945 domain-containing protein [Microbispora triticiradicis]|uniref:DUF2945 domain-containing protein n=1 Tax=Microbispora triticiradicis TaxID=2200763 RepID=UPI001AD75942|nr:DUF2945 domain-containing protein [Microbispora triticiradicis]MBO4271880.1 HVA1 family protein [Microbispora triticiradicis]
MSDKRESEEPKVGDEVTWKSHGGTAEGKVEKKITERTEEAGRTVAASPEDPQYKVRSEKSGGSAVHKPSALHPKK